jgi:glycosyltransferase involved in cell wall biosynthesis
MKFRKDTNRNMCNNAPLVSVVIPTKNRPECLPIAVKSVLQQDHSNLEILVVDDGSNVPVHLDFIDSRIKIIRLESSRGSAVARNIGLRQAHGEFMCLLDDDDFYYPNKISVQLDYLIQHPEVDIVYSLVEFIDNQGNKKVYKHNLNYHWMDNFKQCGFLIHNNSTLFRQRVLDSVSFDERLEKYIDAQFYMAASLHCVIHHLPVVVAVWHIGWNSNQITARNFAKNYRNLKILCEIFQKTLDNYPRLGVRCYKRLTIYALGDGNVVGALKAFMKMLRGYLSR